MPDLTAAETAILANIHLNHQRQLEALTLSHCQGPLPTQLSAAQIAACLDEISDLRLLADSWLNRPVNQVSQTVALLSEGRQWLQDKLCDYLPLPLTQWWFVSAATGISTLPATLSQLVIKQLSLSWLANDKKSGQANPLQMLEANSPVAQIILAETQALAKQLDQLFQFREMLLLGRQSRHPLEPDLRSKLKALTQSKLESEALINALIELYFNQQLQLLFQQGLQKLYHIQEVKIQSEEESQFAKWINQQFENPQQRLTFTQEIQSQFMALTRDYLLEQMHETSLLARHQKKLALIVGLVAASLLGATFGLALGLPFLPLTGLLALTVGIIGSLGSYFLVRRVNSLYFKRHSPNRIGIQQAIDRIDNELLRLNHRLEQHKATHIDALAQSRAFRDLNDCLFMIPGFNLYVSRGSVAGWLREYAARYQHNKAVRIDLGDALKSLISQSREQNRALVQAINHNKRDLMLQWINDTRSFILNPANQSMLDDFDLVAKLREQVLEIAADLIYIPNELRQWYQSPANAGGLGGQSADLNQVQRLLANSQFQALLAAANQLFQRDEQAFADQPILLGDDQFRHLLGLPKGDQSIRLTEANIDQFLRNSLSLLLSLNRPMRPGLGLEPLKQPLILSSEFILYRLLLIKQLAQLFQQDEADISHEVRIKIKTFLHQYLQLDAENILRENQRQGMLYPPVTSSQVQIASPQGLDIDEQAQQLIHQAIVFDLAQHSRPICLGQILQQLMKDWLQAHQNRPPCLLGQADSEQELLPQASQAYLNHLNDYLINTAAFLADQTHANLLDRSGLRACYRDQFSILIYKTMLRLVKLMKEIQADQANSEQSHQLALYQQAFTILHEFSKSHALPLRENSAHYRLFDLVQSQIQSQTVPSVPCDGSILMMLMGSIPNQLFFTPQAKIREDTAISCNQEPGH